MELEMNGSSWQICLITEDNFLARRLTARIATRSEGSKGHI